MALGLKSQKHPVVILQLFFQSADLQTCTVRWACWTGCMELTRASKGAKTPNVTLFCMASDQLMKL